MLTLDEQHFPVWTRAMKSFEELFSIASRLAEAADSEILKSSENGLVEIEKVIQNVSRSFSGSWLGYHAYVYYENFLEPPPGAHFSQEWGLMDLSYSSLGSRGSWEEYNPKDVKSYIMENSGNFDLSSVEKESLRVSEIFESCKSEIISIITTENSTNNDSFLTKLTADIEILKHLSPSEIAQIWAPPGQIMTRDTTAVGQRTRVPPHKEIQARIASIRQAFNVCREGGMLSRKAASHLERKNRQKGREERVGTNVFIGHGRSAIWRELKDFIEKRLQLPWDEFNRIPVAGVTNQARLAEMLDSSAIGLIIMTAEDQTVDGETQARMNVIHEVGLFQGRLGFTRGIIVLEEGCQEFSNIQGVGQIRFPKDRISACFEEIRQVLEREGLLKK